MTACVRALAMTTVALFSLAFVPARAADESTGAWLILSLSDRLPSSAGQSRWRYWLDAQARYPDFGNDINELLIRPGIGYDVSPNVSVFVGYARFRSHTAADTTVTEDRFWQHLAWRFRRWDSASLSMRFRLEQRSLSTGDDTGLLMRYQLKYRRKLSHGGSTEFVASIEPFFDLRDTDYGADAGLSQNRAYLGFGWRLGDKSSVDLGYQNQYFFVDSGRDRSVNLAMIALKSRF